MTEPYNTETVEHNKYADWGLTHTPPAKDGYTFVGWKYKGIIYSPSNYSQTNPFGPITEDVYISAVWTANTNR
jgi:hypothetical protein